MIYLTDRMWCSYVSPSATQSLCVIAKQCGFRRSEDSAPIHPSYSSAAKTTCALCTATRLICPISRIATHLCGKAPQCLTFERPRISWFSFLNVPVVASKKCKKREKEKQEKIVQLFFYLARRGQSWLDLTFLLSFVCQKIRRRK